MELLERIVLLAKQVLSQLSYTPTEEVPLILKHLQSTRQSNGPWQIDVRKALRYCLSAHHRSGEDRMARSLRSGLALIALC